MRRLAPLAPLALSTLALLAPQLAASTAGPSAPSWLAVAGSAEAAIIIGDRNRIRQRPGGNYGSVIVVDDDPETTTVQVDLRIRFQDQSGRVVEDEGTLTQLASERYIFEAPAPAGDSGTVSITLADGTAFETSVPLGDTAADTVDEATGVTITSRLTNSGQARISVRGLPTTGAAPGLALDGEVVPLERVRRRFAQRPVGDAVPERAGGRGGGATCQDVTSAARSDPEGRGAEAEAGVASWRPKAGATRRLTAAVPGRKSAEGLRFTKVRRWNSPGRGGHCGTQAVAAERWGVSGVQRLVGYGALFGRRSSWCRVLDLGLSSRQSCLGRAWGWQDLPSRRGDLRWTCAQCRTWWSWPR
jgi:hypothetical protein